MVTLIIREFISPYLDASITIFITNINYLASSSSLVSQLIISVVTICKIQLLLPHLTPFESTKQV